MEHANRANEDAQRNIKRYAEQIRELQRQIDEDQRKREDFQEKYLNEEKKLQIIQQERFELIGNLENVCI